MIAAVLGVKIVALDVSVDLGGGEIGVPEQFLHGAQVGAAGKQVGGERVAQRVHLGVLYCYSPAREGKEQAMLKKATERLSPAAVHTS